MENSAYVPNSGHMNSPALVVFSQAAGGLQDALRIQRPFNPQVKIHASCEIFANAVCVGICDDGPGTGNITRKTGVQGVKEKNIGVSYSNQCQQLEFEVYFCKSLWKTAKNYVSFVFR